MSCVWKALIKKLHLGRSTKPKALLAFLKKHNTFTEHVLCNG